VTITPLLNTQITDMDEARMTFIRHLADHVAKLREELRISEVILHSVVKSLSAQTQSMADLDSKLVSERIDSSHHRPMVSDENVQELLANLQTTLQAKHQPQ